MVGSGSFTTWCRYVDIDSIDIDIDSIDIDVDVDSIDIVLTTLGRRLASAASSSSSRDTRFSIDFWHMDTHFS